jgi:hypothetical protein
VEGIENREIYLIVEIMNSIRLEWENEDYETRIYKQRRLTTSLGYIYWIIALDNKILRKEHEKSFFWM